MKLYDDLKTAFTHGLVTQAVLRRLKTVGVNIHPYYWIQENVGDPEPARGFDEGGEFTFGLFGESEMQYIAGIPDRNWCSLEMLLSRLEEGKKCLGIKHGNEIAAFNWADFKECNHDCHRIPMQPHEAYLFDMYTLIPFRGMNLAPQVRRQSYRMLREMGYSRFYSISEAFNKPAIRFKLKLNSKILSLHLVLSFFGKYNWHTILRRYD